VVLAVIPASIPSPSDGTLGPLHMYGLMIALGVLAAVELGRARWRAKGGDPDDVYAIAIWAVPAGLIGARLYHLLTDWKAYEGRWGDAVKVWQGGLGIPGGIAAGVGVGLWVAYRRGMRLPVGIDAIIPALPLAQAIGRIGNWWNQEVFGRPTSLPWGLEIDVAHRPVEYVTSTTFHPTFLYELLWNLGLVVVLILVDRRRTLRPGNILPLYIGGYFLGRLWVEALRADDASTILGLRVNLWLSILGIVGAVVALAVRGLRRRPDDSDEPYRDGHRFDPDGLGAGPGAQPAPPSGEDTGEASSGEASVDDSGDDSVPTPPSRAQGATGDEVPGSGPVPSGS
jgi:prolipoprotein diacylglyceryl transferase